MVLFSPASSEFRSAGESMVTMARSSIRSGRLGFNLDWIDVYFFLLPTFFVLGKNRAL